MAEQATGLEGPSPKPAVLIAGASFAGLATAYWLNRLGYAVTIVEIAPCLKRGGTPVDIRDGTVAIMERMGLLEQIHAHRLPRRPMQFMDRHGNVMASMPAQDEDARVEEDDCEIDRDVLLDLLFQHVRHDVELRFADSIAGLREAGAQVEVDFASGVARSYAFVVGCDGNHSAVRRMGFGAEKDYAVFMQHYFAIAVVDRLLVDPQTSHILNAPGKALMLNAYDNKTDIALIFHAQDEISYDYRDRVRQKEIAAEHFAWLGWRQADMRAALLDAPDFYFDKFCQIKMPAWHRGRLVLVGDAAYCASPAAGMGGSLALVGACALGDALKKFPDDLDAAFREYNKCLRPFVEQVQADAVDAGLPMFAPRTEEAIAERNAALAGGAPA